MDDQSYTTSFTVEQSPEEVFKAVTNVRGWWSNAIAGNTEKQDDEFVFEVPDVHYSRQKLVEVVPSTRVVWLVTEANMTFLKQKDEWAGTRIIFDISQESEKTKLTFTHEGLVPHIECYKFCMPAWEQYIEGSLYKLVTTGVGTPNLEGKSIDKPAEI
jgi:hypothetical protein